MTTALDAVNTIGSGSLSAATGIATGPAGQMLYIGLGAAFLVAVAGLIFAFIRYVKD
jgi:VIT1/CCC1 family predicted Fe2+/Mn2+ transporter